MSNIPVITLITIIITIIIITLMTINIAIIVIRKSAGETLAQDTLNLRISVQKHTRKLSGDYRRHASLLEDDCNEVPHRTVQHCALLTVGDIFLPFCLSIYLFCDVRKFLLISYLEPVPHNLAALSSPLCVCCCAVLISDK